MKRFEPPLLRGRAMRCRSFSTITAVVALAAASDASEPVGPRVPEDLPRSIVPGWEKEMDDLRRLFWLHYSSAAPLIPLGEEWMAMATL
jgi:hypothetical protein